MRAGLRLVWTTLTVLPLPAGRVDRSAGRTAMVLAPLVGAGLGVVAAGALAGFTAFGVSPLLASVLTIGTVVLGTRGMHQDGLADTADGLGCGGPPDRALAVMRASDVGPFGVATLVLVLLGQVAALADLAGAHRWLATGLGLAVGRLAITWACRRGVPAARPDGLGVLVAGSVPLPACLALTGVLTAAGWWAVPGRPAQGMAAVLVSVATVVLFTAHVRRRLGGVTGDTLGAACEVAVLVGYTILAG